MKIEILPARGIDVIDVIRRSPVAGVSNAKEILSRYLQSSILSWAGFVDGEVACVWGLISGSFISSEAYLWLHTTDLALEHQFCFIRHSQRMVKEMLQIYPCISGHVVAGQDKSIRWLKWLGVKFQAEDGGLLRFELRAANG